MRVKFAELPIAMTTRLGPGPFFVVSVSSLSRPPSFSLLHPSWSGSFAGSIVSNCQWVGDVDFLPNYLAEIYLILRSGVSDGVPVRNGPD